MSMLQVLTVSQPSRPEFGGRYTHTHDFSPRIPFAKSRYSPQPRVDSPVSSLRYSLTPGDDKMTSHHRGLPPPSSMTLPDPTRTGHLKSLTQPLGGGPFAGMPTPPPQWAGQEESMRNWLVAKAEEDKRKQEEEKTRQETLRLEQRKIEQSMLRESLSGGVPPSMVPMIYAGIGGANLANVSLEWLQQYAGQLQTAQQQVQQQQHPSPDLRREARLIGPAAPAYTVALPSQQQVLASQPAEMPQHPAPLQTTFSAYAPNAPRGLPTSAPRSATHTQLPRLTTNEMYVPNPPQQGPGSAHPLQQSQTIQHDQPTPSPSIYFHHWQPPSESKGSNQPATPASKGEPHSAHPGSHVSESEYRDSPRKRKAQGGHERNPAPNTSPPFSTTSSSTSNRKNGHARTRSNISTRDVESKADARREGDAPQSSLRSLTGEPKPRSSSRSRERSGPRTVEVQREFHVERPGSR